MAHPTSDRNFRLSPSIRPRRYAAHLRVDLEGRRFDGQETIPTYQEVVDLAMEVAGGRSYFRSSPLERAFRDVRAGKYHPMTPERTLLYAGQLALGLPADTIW